MFSLDPLKNAISRLEEAFLADYNSLIRDATIQRFEYTYELSWKTLKRYFKEFNSNDIDNAKNIWREAGKLGLIDSVEDWLGFHKARNMTSHMYSEKVADSVYQSAKDFLPRAKALLDQLESSIDE